MLIKLRDYFAKNPVYFVILRKIIELNFRKGKKLISDVFADQNGRKVLDIGCGTGEYSDSFRPDSYTGIDISPVYIAYAKKTKRGNFLRMDATNLSFPNQSFDIVFISDLIHHLEDNGARSVLKEANRVLKKGGRILILENAKIKDLDNAIVRFVQKFDLGVNIRTPAEYRDIFSSYFLKLKEWEFRSGGVTYYASLMQK